MEDEEGRPVKTMQRALSEPGARHRGFGPYWTDCRGNGSRSREPAGKYLQWPGVGAGDWDGVGGRDVRSKSHRICW